MNIKSPFIYELNIQFQKNYDLIILLLLIRQKYIVSALLKLLNDDKNKTNAEKDHFFSNI
jgi:hypothetical protein